MTCFQVQELLDEYIDDELDGVGRRRVRAHLAACPRCRARLVSRRAALDALRAALRDLDVPPWLEVRVSAALAVAAAEQHEPY